MRPRSCSVVSKPGFEHDDAHASQLRTRECRRVDRDEAHAIARHQQARRIAVRIEQRQRRATDQLPAARELGRIDAGLRAADRDRACRHARARRRAARHVQRRIEAEEIRKSRREAEHRDACRSRPRGAR